MTAPLCIVAVGAAVALAIIAWGILGNALFKLRACRELVAALNKELHAKHELHARDNDMWQRRLDHCNAWLRRIGGVPKHTSADYVAELVRQCFNGDNPNTILKRGRF